jgi:hypothetical protein
LADFSTADNVEEEEGASDPPEEIKCHIGKNVHLTARRMNASADIR